MNATTEQPKLLTWPTTLHDTVLPGEFWAALYTLCQVAKNYPKAIPALKLDTSRGGTLVVMDARDFERLTAGMPDALERRGR